MARNLSEAENAIYRHLRRGEVLDPDILASIPELVPIMPITYIYYQVMITNIRSQLPEKWTIKAVGKGSTSKTRYPTYKLFLPPAND